MDVRNGSNIAAIRLRHTAHNPTVQKFIISDVVKSVKTPTKNNPDNNL